MLQNRELDDFIIARLMGRGFPKEDLLNRRGMIAACIDETVDMTIRDLRED